jgi:hypothetical protein
MNEEQWTGNFTEFDLPKALLRAFPGPERSPLAVIDSNSTGKIFPGCERNGGSTCCSLYQVA